MHEKYLLPGILLFSEISPDSYLTNPVISENQLKKQLMYFFRKVAFFFKN